MHVFLSLSSPRRGSGGRTLQTAIAYSQIHQQIIRTLIRLTENNCITVFCPRDVNIIGEEHFKIHNGN